MCDSIANGGRRCATHTRPPFEAAIARVNNAVSSNKSDARADAIVDVSAHASTRTGHQEVTSLIDDATRAGDHDQAAWLSTCRRLGESQRQAAAEIRRAIQAHRTTPELGDVYPGDVLYTGESHIYNSLTQVRRGTYVRVLAQGHDEASVEVLAFRPNDANRAKRGPRDPQAAYQPATGQVVTVPVSALRRPASNDDTATYYRDHTVTYEGTYYTQNDANDTFRYEPDSHFTEHCVVGPREMTPDERARSLINPDNAQAVVDQVRATGGFTVNPHTSQAPTTGYCINAAGARPRIPEDEFFADGGVPAIQAYAAEHRRHFRSDDGKCVRFRHDTQNRVVVIDRVDVIPDLDRATAFARVRSHHSIWDAANQREIDLGE